MNYQNMMEIDSMYQTQPSRRLPMAFTWLNGNRKLATKLPLLTLILLFGSYLCISAQEAQKKPAETNPIHIESLIQEHSQTISAEMIEIRRDLHRHPEPSGSEVRTAGIVAEKLRSWGLDVRTEVGGHGVVGILRGKSPSPVVAFRADMDATEMDLAEQLPFKSTISGLAHGCGHDVHTTVGLGVARVLSSLREQIPGTVVFIFQPEEENGQGAKKMIAAGVLDNPKPSAIFAFHVAPVEAGTVTTTPGTGLPGVEAIEVQMSGSENLASAANEVANVLRSANTINMPRGPEEFGQMMGWMFDKETNVLSSCVSAFAEVEKNPDGMIVSSMLRTFSQSERRRVKAALEAKLSEMQARGITCKLNAILAIPNVISDQKLGVWAMEPLTEMLGKTSALRVFHGFPFNSEDFAFYLEKIPGVLFWLGASNSPKGVIAVPHSPIFAVDERAIGTGIKAMSHLLFQYLSSQGKK